MDNPNTIHRHNGSISHSPDLDWSQVRETVRLLNLAVAQITASLTEGDDSIDTLGYSFTSMAGGIKAVEELVDSIPEAAGEEISHAIKGKCDELSSRVEAAIVAFQFYDKITQRLSHVCHSLDSLAELVADGERLFHPYEWTALQSQIRSKFTMERDRYMFDVMMKGASVDEAIMLTKKHYQEKEEDNVELF